MTREQHLSFCKRCINRKSELERGLICGITNELASFENECESFKVDETVSEVETIFVDSNKIIQTETERLSIARHGARFFNNLIDQIFVIALGGMLGAFIGLAWGYFAPNTVYKLDSLLSSGFEYILSFLISMTYYVFFEAVTGRSLGKYITKTKVVTEDGKRPKLNAILLRSICRYIPFEAFSFLGDNAVGWHDKLSKTRVVEINS